MAKDRTQELTGVNKLYHARLLAEKGIAPADPDFQGKYPNLFELLSTCKLEGNLLIEPVRLTIWNSSGDWCVTLQCTSLGTYGEIMAPTLSQGLASAEQRLADGTFPFKVSLKRAAKTRELKNGKK